VRIFKYTWFARFTRKENINDIELHNIVSQLEKGQADADLGGDVYKARVARFGEGKSGGYRIVVFFKSGDKTFFQYAYPKAARDNISEKELRFFKKLAKSYLSMTEEQLNAAIKAGEFVEIKEI
jgi:hypothetical protein